MSAPPIRRGRGSNRYNGGVSFNRAQNRWVICCRDGTLILFSRGVMAAEMGRLLTAHEIVHHRNGDTTDDRPENLQVMTRAEHIRLHYADLMRARGLPEDNGQFGSSRYRGVSWDRTVEKWQAYVKQDGRVVYVGRFDDEDAAGRAVAQHRAEVGA